MSVSTSPISNVFPFLRCRNALAQIDWLCKAFGFEIDRKSTRLNSSHT